MIEYLQYKFADSPEFVDTYDELPLWSAPFGLLLFKHLELRRGMEVLDVGSGAGFPLLELAQRLGNSSTCYGIDPWTNAGNRAKQKIKNYGLSNVSLLEGSANAIPLPDESLDLIVSNLGINNFDDPPKVFSECSRVLRPNGRLAITTNLCGHWQEFYGVFEDTLQDIDRPELVSKLKLEQVHRGSPASISALFTHSGFTVSRCVEDKFEMRFADGSAFLNHYFIKLGWLSSWKEIIPEAEHAAIFTLLETALNNYAVANGGLNLTVPMAYIEGHKA
jgi:arsenite methyltransferase